MLVEAGLTIITEAESSEDLSLFKRGIAFRNGLMVALLALYPIRIKNFAALEIGRTLAKGNDSRGGFPLPASETKEGRDDERRIDQIVADRSIVTSPSIDRSSLGRFYLNRPLDISK